MYKKNSICEIFHLIFTLIGVNIKSEVSVSKGRIGSVVETNDTVYIFEFKIDKKPEKSIDQITEKNISTRLNNNYQSYLSSKKEILLIGVNFNTKERNIKDYPVKNLEVT